MSPLSVCLRRSTTSPPCRVGELPETCGFLSLVVNSLVSSVNPIYLPCSTIIVQVYQKIYICYAAIDCVIYEKPKTVKVFLRLIFRSCWATVQCSGLQPATPEPFSVAKTGGEFLVWRPVLGLNRFGTSVSQSHRPSHATGFARRRSSRPVLLGQHSSLDCRLHASTNIVNCAVDCNENGKGDGYGQENTELYTVQYL